ncbi:RNA polymerase sigma factor [Novosphingobium sp. 9]|uniref:RNA polymerase sigma factor n=1 Tax=Novosphingobium sp. 9 TaxID=2025349 RepID=UPI0021B65B5D|nr:sigma-70 family RNA polymerase sigma factor [Novosphingobium sp. 9]
MGSDGSGNAAMGGLQQLSLEMRADLRRFLLARGMAASDAEDLLQDMFLALGKVETGPVRSPRAYLYQMANNMAHSRRRVEVRRQARDARWLDHRTASPPGAEPDRADLAPDPEAAALARDHLARVEHELAQLPERTAYIFRQYRIEGVAQKIIARDLGISLSAVEKHLQSAYRAVLAIRGRLDEDRGQRAAGEYGHAG